jgi:hypothetical protein
MWWSGCQEKVRRSVPPRPRLQSGRAFPLLQNRDDLLFAVLPLPFMTVLLLWVPGELTL